MASCTCTCKTRCVPPCRSNPSLICFEKLLLTIARDFGRSGNPKSPYRQTKMTLTMKTIFHLRVGFISRLLCSPGSRRVPHRGPHALCGTLLGFHRCDGRACDLDFHLVGDANLHGVIFHAYSRAVNPASGDDLFTVFLRRPLLAVPLLLMLRANYHNPLYIPQHADYQPRR